MSFQWTPPASMQGTPPATHWRQQLYAPVETNTDTCRSHAFSRRVATVGSTALSPPGFAKAPARSVRPTARIDLFRDCLKVALTEDRTLASPDSVASLAVDTNSLPVLDAGTTLVGIIDDGIAFASERFRLDADHSRIIYMWQQNHTVDEKNDASAVPMGRELSGADIDAMLRDGKTEAEIYATLGIGRIAQRRLLRQSSYGTSIADTVAGALPGTTIGDVPADKVRILGVNLPDVSVATAANSAIEPFAVLALKRIMDHVTALETKASDAAGHPVHFPLVLMLGMPIADEHPNPPGPLPLLLRQFISDRAQLAPTHVMSPTPSQQQPRPLVQTGPDDTAKALNYGFTVPQDCTRSTILEITADAGIDSIRASLQPPSVPDHQDAPPQLDVGQFACLTDRDAPDRVAAAVYRSGARLMVMIAPSKPPGSGTLGTAQPGNWQLQLTGADTAENLRVVVHRGTIPGDTEAPHVAATPLPRISVSARSCIDPVNGKPSLQVDLHQDETHLVQSAPLKPRRSGETAMGTALATRRLIGSL